MKLVLIWGVLGWIQIGPDPRLTLTDVSQAYSKLLATVWRVSYGGVADNGCFHTAYINAK